jgi:hypothetical protein
MDFLQQLKDLNDGEQNRYGEIEYKFSDNERMKIIENLSNHLKKGDLLTSEENERLTSCIYWGLHGTLGMVECYHKNFIPLLDIPSVKKAFQDRWNCPVEHCSLSCPLLQHGPLHHFWSRNYRNL